MKLILIRDSDDSRLPSSLRRRIVTPEGEDQGLNFMRKYNIPLTRTSRKRSDDLSRIRDFEIRRLFVVLTLSNVLPSVMLGRLIQSIDDSHLTAPIPYTVRFLAVPAEL
jgi:hypothetical protein